MKIVKIKTWEQMEKEFGLNLLGNIDCEYVFTSAMEEDMPLDRIIEVINENWNGWGISEDMIDSVIEEIIE